MQYVYKAEQNVNSLFEKTVMEYWPRIRFHYSPPPLPGITYSALIPVTLS